jgi:type IV secretory pathway VirB9-like protein
MTPPVIFYMFLNIFAPLIINDQFVTTLVFNESVQMPHTGVSNNKIFLQLSPDSKMLFIKSLGLQVETNLNVIGSSGYLYSFLVKSGDRPHTLVQVKDGVNESRSQRSFKRVKNSQGVRVEESRYVARVINKSKNKIQVNSRNLNINEKLYLTKGAPIFISGKRVYR